MEGLEDLIPAIVKVVLGDIVGGQLLTQFREISLELLNRSPKLTAKPAKNRTDDGYEGVKNIL